MNRPASLTCGLGHTAWLLVPAHPTAADDQMLTALLEHKRTCEADQVQVRVKEASS